MMSVPMQADNGDVVEQRSTEKAFGCIRPKCHDNTLSDRSDQVLIEALSNVAAVCVQRTINGQSGSASGLGDCLDGWCH